MPSVLNKYVCLFFLSLMSLWTEFFITRHLWKVVLDIFQFSDTFLRPCSDGPQSHQASSSHQAATGFLYWCCSVSAEECRGCVWVHWGQRTFMGTLIWLHCVFQMKGSIAVTSEAVETLNIVSFCNLKLWEVNKKLIILGLMIQLLSICKHLKYFVD